MPASKTQKYICIHGHFYQPPRENAWLETIEMQDSAAPYHDWNDRITEECYAPNCVSRILDEEGKIVNIVNNLASISYNYGPTLLSWMEQTHPRSYERILQSDKESKKNFGGHGSAMAQVYNHIIMPLASRRDKETQIKWGIYDFVKRFGRHPEGMWLAETAVDLETLELLVENGIRFTVLAPGQAKSFRKNGEEAWANGINTKLPYTCKLLNGGSISLFFYDGGLSQDIAFGSLLSNGKKFAHRLLDAFDSNDSNPQLVHIATDGETYGHHHRHGDMALAFCVNYIRKNNLATIVNYSQFLELCPPQHEVVIHNNSSWSCAHGIERWRSDCGCSTGGGADWNQKWRKPLRDSLDQLNQKLSDLFVQELSIHKVDPWQLRNEYIEVFYKRSKEGTLKFVKKNFGDNLPQDQITQLIRLLEMQKQSMYMYTSCGWFFNDISGIETVQILQYASRAIQLAELATGAKLEPWFTNQLAEAQSNIQEEGSGRDIYYKQVESKRLSMLQVGMHYASYALYSNEAAFDVLNYHCKAIDTYRYKAGGYSMALGRVEVYSRVTLMKQELKYVLLHLGNHHLIGNCSIDMTIEHFKDLKEEIELSFTEGRLADLLDIMQQNFYSKRLTFHDLFKDEQLKILETTLQKNLRLVVQEYENINQRMYTLMNQIRKNKLNVPLFFIKNFSALISIKLENMLNDTNPFEWPLEELAQMAKEKKRWNLEVDFERISFLATRRLNQMAFSFCELPNAEAVLAMDKISKLLDCLNDLDIKPHLHELQNVIFSMSKNGRHGQEWIDSKIRLAAKLNLSL